MPAIFGPKSVRAGSATVRPIISLMKQTIHRRSMKRSKMMLEIIPRDPLDVLDPSEVDSVSTGGLTIALKYGNHWLGVKGSRVPKSSYLYKWKEPYG